MEEAHGIVIVGGGICGLATALALHRKGMSSIVLEKSEALRADGVAMGVHANGWRALEQLGVAADLRNTSNLITSYRNVRQGETTRQLVNKEIRCLRRGDVIETLAKNLPAGAIRFGCRVAAVDADSGSDGAVLTTANGNTIKAKVLIGCDGANSVVAKYVGLGNPSSISRFTVLGITSYPDGHPFGAEFLRIFGNGFSVGVLPITDELVHFLVVRASPANSIDMAMDGGGAGAGAAREYVLEKIGECPAEVAEMARRCDRASLWTLTKVWYRPPWEVALGGLRRGAATVAGDAMHVMGPYIGQGGATGLEDAVVLARSLSRGSGEIAGASAAVGEYVRERRPRVARLSFESFVFGTMVRSRWRVVRLACRAVLALLGNESRRHADFDCGRL